MIFKQDDPWFWLRAPGPILWIIAGLLIGYFFVPTVVIAVAGVLTVLIIVIWIDCYNSEITILLRINAMLYVIWGLLALLIAAATVNHWWVNIFGSLLR